jgi:hypothetical protein
MVEGAGVSHPVGDGPGGGVRPIVLKELVRDYESHSQDHHV